MCSFLTINRTAKVSLLSEANKFLRERGPDATSVLSVHGHTFLHNLLSITGLFSTQPFCSEDGSVICLFNGEIYNHASFGEYRSDGECLLPLYREHGPFFAKKLDGEFAVILYDFHKGLVIIATDPFRTKPLWSGMATKPRIFAGKDAPTLGFASYATALHAFGLTPERIPANTVQVRDLDTGALLEQDALFAFDVKNQHKESYDDWVHAFEEAVIKRAANTEKGVFLGLSGGYDSGAIAAALLHLGLPFSAYSLYAREDRDVLEARCALVKSCHPESLSRAEYRAIERELSRLCEPVRNVSGYADLTTSKGSVGVHWVCEQARKEGKKIQLSGQGADEIFSDYGVHGMPVGAGKHVTDFAGDFPENLASVFPWRNFYEGNQQAFLEVNEHVSGMFGIESRYPFLDANVVQEFLWLAPALKNNEYKAPLHHYLTERNFPFAYEHKTGFSPNANLRA